MEQYFVLENGVKLPKIGYGTYKSTDGSGGRIIRMALEAGYRLLDTAAVYENETEVGTAIRESGVPNETDGTDIPAMEAIAFQAPLSALRRPEWDRKVLERLGMAVETDPEIWRTVWTREERINNSSTPMFLVRAVKRKW